jgi:hypothetical protein
MPANADHFSIKPNAQIRCSSCYFGGLLGCIFSFFNLFFVRNIGTFSLIYSLSLKVCICHGFHFSS